MNKEKPIDWIKTTNELPDNPKYKLVDDIVFVDSAGVVHLGIYANGSWEEWGPNMFETMEWITVRHRIDYWLPIPHVPEND
jgi:hypothetical protein